jgi:Reverse transcriptase (RNA-dependent DNA polymerase)
MNNVEPEQSTGSTDSPRYPRRNAKPINKPYDAYLWLTAERKPPSTLAAAHLREDWTIWRTAINAELQSHWDKQVNFEVPLSEVPPDKQPIPSKWVFDYKTDTQDAVVGYKARCVGKGFYQTEGVDYYETSAPTIMDVTLRMLLQYAVEWKLTIRQIDVKTAFLNGELIEEVYIRPPPGVGLKHRVWKLNKALYGLKQAARAWYEKWTKVLFRIGLKPSAADPCLYIPQVRSQSGHYSVVVGLYVDDALVVGTQQHGKLIFTQLSKEFEVKDMGFMKPGVPAKFLGMELEMMPEEDGAVGIVVKQERYANELVGKFRTH